MLMRLIVAMMGELVLAERRMVMLQVLLMMVLLLQLLLLVMVKMVVIGVVVVEVAHLLGVVADCVLLRLLLLLERLIGA